jgi:outer membrane protein assembly factor BamB
VLFPLQAFCQPIDDRITVGAADWPWWRGPQRDGVANPNQDPPTEWSASRNVAWTSAVPGRGHSSPTVVGRRVYLATADEEQGTQSVLCYDRETGNQLWQSVVHRGGLMRKNEKSTAASGTCGMRPGRTCDERKTARIRPTAIRKTPLTMPDD